MNELIAYIEKRLNYFADEADDAIKASKTADNLVETLMVDIIINSKGHTNV